jgi:hypothetical protein
MKELFKFLEELPSAVWTFITSIIRKVRFSIWDYVGVEETIKIATYWVVILILAGFFFIIAEGLTIWRWVYLMIILLLFALINPIFPNDLITYSTRKLESASNSDVYAATRATELVIRKQLGTMASYPDIFNIINSFSRPEAFYSYVSKGYFDLFEKYIIPIALYGTDEELKVIREITSQVNSFLESRLLPVVYTLKGSPSSGRYREVRAKTREQLSRMIRDFMELFLEHRAEIGKLDTAEKLNKLSEHVQVRYSGMISFLIKTLAGAIIVAFVGIQISKFLG